MTAGPFRSATTTRLEVLNWAVSGILDPQGILRLRPARRQLCQPVQADRLTASRRRAHGHANARNGYRKPTVE